ncbi:MAG: aldehyde dehydrogenase, partial [Myxococcales bacterium]|nr:aldehyde dehydrogenase [Myxococcales bacterium]
MEPTPIKELDSAIATLVDNKDRWIKVSVGERIKLLRKAMDCTLAGAEAQVREACKAKGIPYDTPISAEEWLGGPMTVMRNLRLLAEVLESIETYGRPSLEDKAVNKRGDQLVVNVFPRDGLDKLMY